MHLFAGVGATKGFALLHGAPTWLKIGDELGAGPMSGVSSIIEIARFMEQGIGTCLGPVPSPLD